MIVWRVYFRVSFQVCIRKQTDLEDQFRTWWTRLHNTARSSSQDFWQRKTNSKFLVKANQRPICSESSQKTDVTKLYPFFCWFKRDFQTFDYRNMGYFDKQPSDTSETVSQNFMPPEMLHSIRIIDVSHQNLQLKPNLMVKHASTTAKVLNAIASLPRYVVL